jgi:hypothetical protein
MELGGKGKRKRMIRVSIITKYITSEQLEDITLCIG